ncbi:MAG: gliding motility-associated C-terminal domain-containing protein [Bacteroidota bacterium]
MKNLIGIFLLFKTLSFSGQEQNLDQHLIHGASGQGDYGINKRIHYSIGEPISITGASINAIYTQGFHQPFEVFSYSLVSSATSCSEANDGSFTISNIQGCQGPYTINVGTNAFSDTIVQNLAAGTYEVSFSGNNCAIDFQVLIENGNGICDLVFFNAFSPNADGDNDSWRIQNIELESYSNNEVEIYNRHGVLVWSGANYNNSSIVFRGFDNNMNELSSGTYFYVARVEGNSFSGFIEMLK